MYIHVRRHERIVCDLYFKSKISLQENTFVKLEFDILERAGSVKAQADFSDYDHICQHFIQPKNKDAYP